MKERIILSLYLFSFLVVCCFAAPAEAAEATGDVHTITLPNISVELKAGAGRDKVATFCNICHSTDYIVMQPRFSGKKWSAIVQKMINVFGAPVNEADAAVIRQYLTAQYGSNGQEEKGQ